MVFRNHASGEFGHRTKPANPQRPALLACAVVGTVLLVGAQATTQWLAAKLHYQKQLGKPVLDLRPDGPPLYAPWTGWTWKRRLEATAGGATLADTAAGAFELSLWLALALASVAVSAMQKRAVNRVAELHGSARWATLTDIEQAGLLDDKGVVIGAWEDPKTKRVRFLRHHGPDHILFFATTGSGKGVGCIIPTLLTWRASALVLDLKGENFALTSGYRRSIGHNVFKLDFGADPDQTAHFNLLDFIRFGTLQEEADVQRVCTARIDPTGALRKSHSDGHHWLSTGIGFMAAAVLHSVYRRGVSRDKRCPVGLSHVAADLSDPRKTFEALMEEWLTYRHDPNPAGQWRDHDGKTTATHPIVSAVARIQLGRSPNERSAVMSTVMTALEVFRDPLLSANTNSSDFTIEDLMDADQPTSLYFIVRPNDLDRLAPVVRLFLDLVIRRLTEQMTFVDGHEAGTHKHELLLVLDELPALGKVNVIAEALGYFRGWNIKALIAVQSLMQLREHFGRYESISGLCGISAAYAPAKVDVETAKHLSAMCGTTTVIRRSPSRAWASSGGDPNNEQELARPLLTPDEVSCLPGPQRAGREIVQPGQMLVFASGCPAIYGRQCLFFQSRLLKERSKLPPAPPMPDDRLALRVAVERSDRAEPSHGASKRDATSQRRASEHPVLPHAKHAGTEQGP